MFAAETEAQFRCWYVRQARARMRYTMLPAMLTLFAVSVAGGPLSGIRATLFDPADLPLIDVLRFGVMAPTCIAMVVVTFTRLYKRWLSITSHAVTLLQGLCFVTADALMQKRGYSLSAWMPLVVLAPYLLFGLLQYQAARISSTMVLAYLAAGWLTGLHTGQRHFDAFVIAFASFMGFIVHYSFAVAVRHNWFTHRVLNDSAHRDALTGIANRRMFDDHLRRLWSQCVRTHAPLALLLIDLDKFKAYNDYAGHQAGDACLARIARAISGAARRPLDLSARYGGEEFVVLLYDAKRERVEQLCREIHDDIAALAIPHAASEVKTLVTASIGAACVQPAAGRHPEGLVQLADEALYAAKERGRNDTVIMDREYETLTTGAFRVQRRSAAA